MTTHRLYIDRVEIHVSDPNRPPLPSPPQKHARVVVQKRPEPPRPSVWYGQVGESLVHTALPAVLPAAQTQAPECAGDRRRRLSGFRVRRGITSHVEGVLPQRPDR